MSVRDTYIFGKPIKTEYGLVRFLTFEEYVDCQTDLFMINQNVLHWYYIYLKKATTKEDKEQCKDIKNLSLSEFIRTNHEIILTYCKIFQMVLDVNEYDDETLDNIIATIILNNDNLLEFRTLVMNMNAQIEDEVNPNEKIQEYIDKGRELKVRQSKNNRVGIMDIVTALVVGTPHTYGEVADMTILQAYAAYYRLMKFKDYDTTTLFATVSGDVKISSWAEHIDMFEQEKSGITEKEFNKKYGGLFKK